MLETIRNIFRNIILQKEKSSKQTIKLLPKLLSRPSAICYSCKRIPQCYGDFWILRDNLHIFSDTCEQCDCSRKEHADVYYRLDYKLLVDSNEQTIDEMMLNLKQPM